MRKIFTKAQLSFPLALALVFMITPLSGELVPKHELAAHKITLEVAKDLHIRYGLEPIALGGSMMTKIEGFALTLRTYKSLSVEQARACVLDCVALYLQKINASSEVEPFLQEKPFTAKQLTLQFLVLEQNDLFKKENSLANFYLDKGKIVYKKCNSQTGQLEKVQEETYDQVASSAKK